MSTTQADIKADMSPGDFAIPLSGRSAVLWWSTRWYTTMAKWHCVLLSPES